MQPALKHISSAVRKGILILYTLLSEIGIAYAENLKFISTTELQAPQYLGEMVANIEYGREMINVTRSNLRLG
jgi:hypothetical protein